jgi:hypothetical protein
MAHLIKALRVIEGSLLIDEPQDEWLRFIYRMAHAGLGECEHLDWIEELEKVYKSMKAEKVI